MEVTQFEADYVPLYTSHPFIAEYFSGTKTNTVENMSLRERKYVLLSFENFRMETISSSCLKLLSQIVTIKLSLNDICLEHL